MILKLIMTIILVHFLGSLLGYWVHWIFHQPWSGPLFQLHKTHHEVMYPANDFTSEKYRDAGKGNTAPWFTGIVASVMLPVFTLMWIIGVPIWILIVIATESVVIGLVNNWVHDTMHIKGHFMERFRVFRVLRIAHRVHHSNTRYNLGIFTFEWDKVFKTWKKPHMRDKNTRVK